MDKSKEIEFEKYVSLIDQLSPEARNDVLDVSVFLVWKQTLRSAPWKTVLRGAWLFVTFKVQNFFMGHYRKADKAHEV